jgi:hypothetical protein
MIIILETPDSTINRVYDDTDQLFCDPSDLDLYIEGEQADGTTIPLATITLHSISVSDLSAALDDALADAAAECGFDHHSCLNSGYMVNLKFDAEKASFCECVYLYSCDRLIHIAHKDVVDDQCICLRIENDSVEVLVGPDQLFELYLGWHDDSHSVPEESPWIDPFKPPEPVKQSMLLPSKSLDDDIPFGGNAEEDFSEDIPF